jgi:hypothetical protein
MRRDPHGRENTVANLPALQCGIGDGTPALASLNSPRFHVFCAGNQRFRADRNPRH